MPQAGSGQKRRGKEKAAKRERESQVRRNSRSEVDEMQKYLGFPNCSQAQNFVLAQAAQGKSKRNAKENAREMRLIRELS